MSRELRLPINSIDVFPYHDHMDANSLVQVSVIGFHDIGWCFSHNYQHSDNRYIISVGWRNFHKQKNITVGDSMVFVKTFDEKIFVGIRRKTKVAADVPVKETKTKNNETGVNAYNVMQVLNHIKDDEPFEVEFHPKICDFLVDPKYIEESKHVV